MYNFGRLTSVAVEVKWPLVFPLKIAGHHRRTRRMGKYGMVLNWGVAARELTAPWPLVVPKRTLSALFDHLVCDGVYRRRPRRYLLLHRYGHSTDADRDLKASLNAL